MLTAEQLEERRNWIGASDLACDATGLYGGTMKVMASKIYGADYETNDYMELGNCAESAILDWAVNELNEVEYVRQTAVKHPDATTHIRATCDGRISSAAPHWGFPCEAKLVFPHAFHEWTDAEPSMYALVQVNVQMDCCECDHGYVAAWLVGKGKRLYRVSRDAALCEALRDRARYLWTEFIEPRRMPETTTDLATISEAHALRLPKFGIVPGRTVELGGGHQVIADIMELASKAKGAEDRLHDGLRNLIGLAMGDAETGALPDGTKLVRKKIERAGYTVEPSEYVELRRVKSRKGESNGD